MDAPKWNEERKCWTVGETDTHFVEIVPMLDLTAIVKTPKNFTGIYDERWDYPNIGLAILDAIVWDAEGFAGEPEHWTRHLPTGRRRKDGDPSTEYVEH